MGELSKESKMVIASNLTVAALIRELIIAQTAEKPVVETKEVVTGTYRMFLEVLEKEDS
jgi:hypothetical protein